MAVMRLILSVIWIFPVLCFSGKVLVLHPGVDTSSHVLALRTLVTHMASRGHQVTIVRWLADRKLPDLIFPNVTEYVLAVNNSQGDIPLLSHGHRARFIHPFGTFWENGLSFSQIPANGFHTLSEICATLFQEKEMIQHFKDAQFDVALVDLAFNECSLLLAHHLGIPIVGFWAYIVNGFSSLYTQAFSPPSLSPVMISKLTSPMGFLQRVYNYGCATINHVIIQMAFYVADSAARTHLGPGPGPAAILANISGMLINSQPPIQHPWLMPPMHLPVGGFHIREEKPLPKDLQSWIDGSGSHGTVIVSFGASFASKIVPPHFVLKLLAAFGKLNQRVIMRFGGSPKNIPKNVKLVNWFPQRDVLAHPNVVLFVSHSGIIGVLEALYHGVPLVGMPIFGDGPDTLQRLRELGLAYHFEKTSSAEEIHAALTEGLTNPQYKEAAGQMSSHLRSLPVSPLQTATWLMEHVMKTQGAHHYKFPTQNLNCLQYYGIDVLAFILTIICIVIKVLFIFYAKIFSRKVHKVKSKVT